MFYLRDNGFVFFMVLFYIRVWEDLEKRIMRFVDLLMWDVIRDFLLLDMVYRYCLIKYIFKILVYKILIMCRLIGILFLRLFLKYKKYLLI